MCCAVCLVFRSFQGSLIRSRHNPQSTTGNGGGGSRCVWARRNIRVLQPRLICLNILSIVRWCQFEMRIMRARTKMKTYCRDILCQPPPLPRSLGYNQPASQVGTPAADRQLRLFPDIARHQRLRRPSSVHPVSRAKW